MLDSSEVEESEQSSSALTVIETLRGTVKIPNAAPVRLQTLDLARHTAVAPNGKRYVVATFDDRRLHGGFTTAIYPQQGGYLTLIRLTIGEVTSQTPEQAVQKQIEVVQLIQQGKLDDFVKKLLKD
jgi:DNA-binding beta-propeller fold protein YncE